MNAKTIKPIAALALTAAGSALVVGFKTPEAALTAATTGPTSAAASTTSGAANPTAGSAGSTGAAQATPGATSTAGSGAGAGSTAAGSTGSTSPAGSTSSGTGSMASATSYADGTYLGAAVSEPWGTFQVQVTISGGKITAVTMVSGPRDRRSTSINNNAVPRLTAAAIAKQSAEVDLISGATWTARSYRTSLQAALDQAAAKKAA